MKNFNASASAFGWQFQINAAIVFMLKKIKDIDKVRIEGENEDIELELSNNKGKIFIQAKSRSEIGPASNALKNFSDGVKTLIHSSNKKNCEELCFVTNYPNPIGGREQQFSYFMGGTYIKRSFKEIPDDARAAATDKINKVENEVGLKLDIDKLYIAVIPFDGNEKDTRERVINTEVKDFLYDIKVDEGSSRELLEFWQNKMHFNASNTDTKVSLSKKELMWPIVVLKCDLNENDKLIEECEAQGMDYEDVVTILEKYKEIINKQEEHFDLTNKIVNDYRVYREENSKGNRGKRNRKDFIESNWSDYKDYIKSDQMDEITHENLVKIILTKILNTQNIIKNLKEEVNL